MSPSNDSKRSRLRAKVLHIKELMKGMIHRSDQTQAEETDEVVPTTTGPYVPDEIWLDMIRQFPGERESIKLHRAYPGGWNALLNKDTLDWQYGLLSLGATCKRMCDLVNQSYTRGTLFIHQPTTFFEGLGLSLAKSPAFPPELMTMKNINKFIFVNNSDIRYHLSSMYHKINAEVDADCQPRTYLTTSNRILPRLTSIVLCTKLQASVGSKFKDKQEELWMKHWAGDEKQYKYLKQPRHGLEIQLATFARDNGQANFTAYRNAGEYIMHRETWPGGTGSDNDKGYVDLQKISINSLEYGLEDLTDYLPACPVSGSWCISSKYSCNYSSDECIELLGEMARKIDSETPGPKWAKVYLPPIQDLYTKEQEDEYLAEEQTKLNSSLVARGKKATMDTGTARIELDWMRNAPDESKWGIPGDWVQTPSKG